MNIAVDEIEYGKDGVIIGGKSLFRLILNLRKESAQISTDARRDYRKAKDAYSVLNPTLIREKICDITYNHISDNIPHRKKVRN